MPPDHPIRRRWDIRKAFGFGKRRRGKPAAAGVLLFEPLEPRILLSADPLNSTALTSTLAAVPVQLASVQPAAPVVSLSAAADTSALDALVTPSTTTTSTNPAPPVSGTLAVPGQVDTYTFSLTNAKDLYFDSLTNNSSIVWTLKGPTGTVVNQEAFAYSDAQYNSNPVLQLGAGTYTLSVSGNSAAIGAYAFRLLDLSTASPITPGTQVSDTLSPGNSTNAYQFSGTAGQRVFLEPQAGSGIYWRLIDPFGNVVANTADSFGAEQPTLATSGTYTLLVEGYPYATTATQNFSFTVYPQADTTTSLTLGQTTQGDVSQPGQLNKYSFTLASPTLALFDSLTNDGSLTWSVTGPGGSVVSGRGFSSDAGNYGGGNESLSLAAGSYTLTVAGNSDHTAAYAFRLLDFAAATPTEYGQAISGTLDDAGASGAANPPGVATQLYAFTAAAGDQIALHSVSQSGGTIYERLFDPYGNQVSFSYLQGGITQTLLLSGTYTLAIEGSVYDGSPANYAATLAQTGSTTIAPPTGTALSYGVAAGNTFATAGETDDYVFNVTSPVTLQFDPLTTPYTTSLSAQWQLVGPTGTIITPQNFYYNNTFTLTVPGTYQLQVTSTGAAGQSYSFQLLNFAGATPITYGSTVSDTLTPATATKLYSFTATAGDSVYFNELTSNSSLNWQLWSPQGNEIFNSGQGFSPTGPYTLATAGTYTLVVGGDYYATGTATYSFAVVKDTDTTAALQPDTVVSGSIAAPGQTASYTFSRTAGAPPLYLDVLGQYNGLYYTLTGPDGTVVGQTGLQTYNNRVLALGAGQYTLTVFGSGNSTGAYSFQLLDLAAAGSSFSYGQVVSGTNTPPQADGVFHFTGTAGDQVFFDTLSDSDNYSLQWQVLDPFGNTVFSKQGFSPVSTQTLALSGTYTVLVEGYYYDPNPTAAYSFRVSPVTTTTTAITVDGPAQTGPLSIPGPVAGTTALSFTDTEGASVPNGAAVNQTGAVSVSFWINPDTYGNPWTTLVYKGSGSVSSRTYSVWLNSSGFIHLSTYDASGEQTLDTANGSVPLHQWTQVTAVFDRVGGTMSVYLNGVLAGTAALREDAPNSGSYPLTIAQGEEGWASLQGGMADVAIFSQALSATQAAAIYQNGISTTASGLVLYVPMNEKSGATTLADDSPTGATVTVNDPNAGLPGTITGRIAAPGDTTQYTFTLSSATELLFDGLSDDSNLTITLTGPNQLNVSRNLRNGDTYEFGGGNPVIAAPAGQYTITVSDSGDRSEDYAFRFINLADAQSIAYNSTVANTLNDGGETQAYSFTATAGDQVYLNLLSWTKGGGDADWRLIDPYGNQVFGPSNFADVGATTLAYSGTYILLAEGRTWEPASGSYSFRLDLIQNQTVALTLGTNPAGGAVWSSGQLGGAVTLTGADGIAVPDSPSLDLTDNVTLQAWINVSQMPSTWAPILYKGTGAASNGTGRTYSLWLNSSGYIYLGSSTSSGSVEGISSANGLITPGQWIEVTGVIDRTNGLMHLYINGVDVADGSISSQLAPVSNNPLLIGATQEVNSQYSNFQGSIDDVRVWSSALPAAQIAAQYATPLTGTQAGLALYLKLDDGAGTNAVDSSGNGNNGSFVFDNAQGVTGQITIPGQQINYDFTVTSAGQYYFDDLIDNSNFNWTLTGPQGSVVAGRSFTSSDADRGNPLLNLVAGNYVLTVAANGATTGYFNFRLLSFSTAQALIPGTPVAVTLNPGSGTSLYNFTATAGEQVYFDQSAFNGNVYVRVIDPLGHDLYGAVYAGSLPNFGVQTLALAGTYTVLIDADPYYDPDLSTITLNVQPVVNKTGTLSLGTAVSSSIDTAGQAAIYSFNLANATTAYFDALSDNSNLNWTLTGPGGTLISARSFTSSDSYDQGNVALALAAGAYTLTVRSSNDTTGAFSFNLLDFAQATPIAVNTPTAIGLAAMSTQLFSFTGTAGERVQLLSTVDSGDVAWRLIDPNGNILFGPQALTTEPSVTTLATTGTYTLAIEGRIYTNSPISGTLVLLPLSLPAVNGAVSVQVPAAQSTPVDLGYFAAGTYQISAVGVASLVSSFNDPNALLFSPNGSLETATSRNGFAYLNAGGSPVNKPDGNIYGPGGTSIDLGALMGTLTATPASPADYFLIGNGTSVTLTSAGHIYAQINDTVYSDNEYGYQVTLTPATSASGATTQSFSAAGLPYALSSYSGTPASVASDSTGTFLRLTSAASTYQNNVADFSSTASGPLQSVQADFDFRITAGSTAGLGIGAVLLNGANWGTSGPSTSYAFIPSVTGGLGVKLSVSNDGNNNEVALTWNGNTITQAASSFSLSNGAWDHATIVVQRTNGGSLVSVTLTPNGGAAVAVLSNVFVGGYFPDTTRLALEASTDYRSATQDVDNVALTTTPLTTAIPTLSLNSLTTGSIVAAGAVETYQFTLTAPVTALFDSLTNNGNFAWSLTGPGGTIIGGRSFTQSDSVDLGSSPAIALAAGTYTLSVYGNYSATGAYGFQLDTLASATPLTPGSAVSATLDPGNSSALYSFTATAGERFSISGVSGWNGTQYYRVLDPNGAQVISSTPLYQDTGAFTATVAGTYTLLIEGRYYASSPSSYGFTLNQVVDQTATLVLNTVTTGTITTAGQRAIYSFALAAPQTLYFDSLTNDGDFTWTLTAPDGTQIAAQSFNQNDFGAFLAQAGSYTLTISNPNTDGHTGPFSFRILDLQTAATPFVPGTAVTGTLDQVQGTDAYSFTAAAGSKFYFDEIARTNNLNWQLVDPFGNTVFGATNFSPQGFVTLSASGTYTVLIQGQVYNSGSASFTFNLVPPATATAAVNLGSATNGTIGSAGAVNAYTFTLTQPTSVVLATLADTLNGGNIDSSLTYTLTGPSGVVRSGDFYQAIGTFFGGSGSPATVLPAGAYTLTFSASNDATGSYTFRLINLAAATPLVLGSPVSGTLTPGSDTRVYSFTGTAGEVIYPQETSYAGGSLIWRLLDPNNLSLFYDYFGSNPGSITLPVSGTYTLLLEGALYNANQTSASYGFTVYATPASNPVPIGGSGVQAPDLVVQNLAVSGGTQIQSGGKLTVSWTDGNIGTAATNASWTDRVIVSRADNGQILANVSLPYNAATSGALAAGGSAAQQVLLSLPAGSQGAGALIVTVTTDAGNTVSEQNASGTGFSNNTTQLAFTSALAAYPDLQVSNVALSPAAGYQPGDSVTVSWTLANAGNADVTVPFTEQVTILNTQTNQTIALLSDSVSAGVAAGSSANRSLSFTWPAGYASTGTFLVSVTADSTGQVVEAVPAGSRTDNTATTTVLSAPDLAVSNAAITPPASLSSGNTVTIGWTDANLGNAATPVDFNDHVYVVNTTTGAQLANATVDAGGALAIGATRARSYSFTLPAGSAGAGNIAITITANQDIYGNQAVLEATAAGNPYANNVATVSAASQLAVYPDLVTTTTVPANGQGGSGLTLGWTVTNNGPGATTAGAWTDEVVLSTTPNLGAASDVVLGTFAHSGDLAAGAAYTQSQAVTLPANLQGTYYITVIADSAQAVLEPDTRADATAAPAAIAIASGYAQFTTSNVGVPATASQGGSILVTWNVANQGNATTDVSAWTDNVYLVSGTNLTSGAVLLGSLPHLGSLAAGASYTGALSVVLPSNVTGTYHVVVQADAGNVVYQNGNTGGQTAASGAITIGTPDLQVSAITAPTAVQPGQSETIGWTVTNAGIGNAPGGWTDAVEVAADGLLADATVLAYVGHGGGLAAGASYSQSVQVTIPNLADGSATFFVVADIGRQVTEANGETDNSAAATPAASLTHPDLAALSVSAPASATPTGTISVSWVVANQGSAAISGGWTDQVYIASASSLDGSQVYLGSISETGPLAAGAHYTGQLTLTLPQALIPGTYHILVLTNANGSIDEAGHSANNIAASAAISIGAIPLPDLQIGGLAVSPASGIISGSTFAITWNAVNAGGGAVTSSFYSHVVVVDTSTGQTIADQQVFYDAAAHGAIAGGASAAQSLSVTLPNGTAGTGNLAITVTADSYGQVYEGGGTRTDNTAAISATSALAPYADLTVQNLSVAPANPNSGNAITIDWTTTNSGTAPVTAAFADEVIVVNQTTGATLADQTLAYNPATSGAIAAGSGVTRSTNVTLPAGTPGVGTLLVKVITDGADQVPELVNANRTDNAATTTLTSTINQYPDLEVSNISAPANAAAGATVSLSYTVTNAGTGSASGAWAEQISLSSDGSAARDVAVQGVSVTGQSIAPGASLTRTVSVTLPAILDGSQYFSVTADSLGSLVELNQVSHRGVAASPIVITPGLVLSLTQSTVSDKAGNPAFSAVVTRSGDVSQAVTVRISADQSGLVLPNSVTIAAGQSAVAFQIGAVNSGITGPTVNINITASAAGYSGSTQSVAETDDNTPALTLMGPATVNRNAGTVTFTLTRNTPTDSALSVNLLSNLTEFIVPPATVTFAAGQSTLTVNLPLADDGMIYGSNNVTLTASAPGLAAGSAKIFVNDTDIPTLSIALAQSTVSEAAGANATTLTVTRSVVTNQAVNITVGTMPGQVRIGSGWSIAAGAASVSIPVGVVDLGMPTSETMAVGILVSVADPSFGVQIAGTGVSTTLNITGSVGPNLAIGLAATTTTGGSTVTGTVTRADGDTSQPLTVQLASSNTNEATVPAQVVIAAGQSSANFTVNALNDGALNSVTQLTLSATAANWATGYQGLTVSNQNLPNLAVSSITNTASVVSGGSGTVSYTVTNTGANAATGPWTDHVYLCDNVVLNNDAVLIASPQISSLAAGQSYTQSASFTAGTPGTYYIIVVADSGKVVQTISPGDKQRTGPTAITVTPAYTATVAALTHVAPAGTTIILSGSATSALTNAPDPFVQVTVTITNGGFVRTLQAFTDPNGNFKIAFTPVGRESGTYSITAAQPGATPPPAQDTFELLGLSASVNTINIAGLPNQTLKGSFTLTDTTAVPLTALTAALSAALPATATISFTPIANIAGNGTVTVYYSFTSTAPITGGATLNIKSAEGATIAIPISVSVLPLTPDLVANPGYLNAGMVVGSQSQVSFVITNTGGAESGPLSVTLPNAPWLSLQSAATIASIAAGGTATVVLQLTPDQSLALQEYQGSVVIAGAAASVTVPFTFRAVSTATGDVDVTVTDESTYFATGAPNLAGATVTLTDPYTSQVIATAVSDATGVAHFTGIDAGGYTLMITAPSHAPFQGTVTIVPGIDNTFTEFVHYEAVSYTWAVVPTTQNDNYQIVLQSTFQTAVPMPVVTVDQPLLLPLVLPGQITTETVTFTNHGLIAANDLQISVPTDPDFIITPLVSQIDVLPAGASVSVPITVQFSPTSPFLAGATSDQTMSADGEISTQGAAGYAAAIAKCFGITAVYTYVCLNNVWQQVPISMDTIGCVDNYAGAVGAIKNALTPQDLKSAGCSVLDTVIACLSANNSLSQGYSTLLDCGQAILVGLCGYATGGPAGVLGAAGSDILTCLCDLAKYLPNIDFGDTPSDGGGGFDGGGGYGGSAGTAYLAPVGYDVPTSNDCGPVASSVDTTSGSTTSGSSEMSTSMPMTSSSSVCAQVVVQLSQQAVVTRTAFVGTLDIMNSMTGAGSDLTNLSVSLNITDMMGNAANDMFLTEGPTQSGFTGSLGTLTLSGGSDGTLQYTFVPTIDAAQTMQTDYEIGGVLTYTQNGVVVDVPLAAALITVYPEAQLNLSYFWQRNVIGDDPFTPQVEPSEPFYLGLRVSNVGAGNAGNLTITSSQPQIIENQKGLLVNFQIIGSQVQNDPSTNSLTVDLGTIAPGQTTTADWELLSTLQGRFTNFSASFSHEDDGGSLRTSLIKSVTIAPLIEVVHVGDDGATQMPTDNGVPSFLVENTTSYTPDGDAIPDTLYIGDQSGSQPVTYVPTAQWTAGPGGTEILTAPASTGWSYIDIADPAPGLALVKIVRSDGEVLTLGDTVWRSDRVFPPTIAGALDINLIHLLDYNSTGSYTFYFISDDGKAPHITSVQDLSGSVLTPPVATINVTFSKPIDLTTLTDAAVSLTLNGAPVALTGLSFTDEGTVAGGGETYQIGGLSAFTEANGNYTLSIDGTEVADLAGTAGDNAVSTSFTVSDGPTVLTSLAPVTPNERNIPVQSIDVGFSAPIAASSFTAGALSLTVNGNPVALGSAVSVVPLTPTTLRIGGLATVTNTDGLYALTVDASQVNDTTGAAAVGKLTDTWTEDTSAPTITAIAPISPNPRNTIVQSVVVTLSKPIDPTSFDYHAVTVTQNGGPNLVTSSTTVTEIDPTHYQIAGFNNSFSAVTGFNGTYVITVSAAGLVDLAGNTGTGSVSESWVFSITPPAAASNVAITPDRGISNTDGLTNTLAFTVTGNVDAPTDLVQLSDLTTNTDLGFATVSTNNGVTSFVGPVALTSPGTHKIEVAVVDAAGNVNTTTTISVFIDLTPPMVSAISTISPNPRTTPIDSVTVTLSKDIEPGTFTAGALSLTLNGTALTLPSGVVITSVGSDMWQVSGLSAVDAAPGVYDLTVNAAGLVDDAGNSGTGSRDESWTVVSTSATGGFGGLVYQDTTGSGTHTTDGSDPGLAGFTVFIDQAGTGMLAAGDPTATTAANGSYSFSGLAAGTYMVMVVPQTGFLQTTAASYSITIGTGQTLTTSYNFGEFQLASLSGTVFDDANANGAPDSGEAGIAGITVFLDPVGDGVYRSTDATSVTNAAGAFSFTAIGPGTVRLGEVLPAGEARTTAVTPIVVTSGYAATNLTIGDVKLGSISGTLFNDLNGDGVQEAGEPALAGWTVFIDAQHDGQPDASDPTAVTDANGNYTFSSLLPGAYSIGEVLQPGFVETSPLATAALTSSADVAVVTEGSDVPLQLDGTWTGPAGQNYALLTNQDADAISGLTAALQNSQFANLQGQGETTVVIDTGIDNTSSFFGPVSSTTGDASRIVYEYDFADGTANASDTNGHGSNVAGIIAGSDATYPGVAPDANLIILKVFNNDDQGTFGYVQQALDWVAANAATYHIGVVNMSLGDGQNWSTDASRYGLGPVLSELNAEDIITVAAAGNNYADYESPGVAYPAADPDVVAVGAVWTGNFGGPYSYSSGGTDYSTSAEQIAAYSQRSQSLLATFAPGSALTGASDTGGVSTLMGTSQASAFVAGAATLVQELAQKVLGRQLSSTEFAALLRSSGVLITDNDSSADNVTNTGLSYPTLNMVNLFNAVEALAGSPAPVATGGSSGGSTAGGPVITTATPAPGLAAVTLSEGQNVTGVNFGNFQQGAISGTVFNDANRDGVQEAGESGLAGITVFLDAAGTGVLAAGDLQTTTDAQGNFSFINVGPGAYLVQVVLPSGELATSADPVRVVMSSGLAATADFGLSQAGPTSLSASGPATATIGQTYTITFAATDPGHSITEWYVDWGDGTLQGIAGNPQSATHVYASGGKTFTIAVSAMDDTGIYDATPFTVTVAPPLQVVSVTQTVSGVSVRFNNPIDPTTIHLYDTQGDGLGAADVTLVGASTGAVSGSVVFDADLMGFTFIKTGGPLAADTYTLTLVSGLAAFHDSAGGLDGADSGVPGSANAIATFTVAASSAAILSLPDFARAPGQAVNYAVGGTGLPLTLTNAAGITAMTFEVDYDPSLLTISGVVANSMPAGTTLTVSVTTPGKAVFSFASATPLGGGSITLGNIIATVPTGTSYGTRQILRLGIDSVTGGTAIGDNALEVVALLGDTDGNGQYDAADASLVQRVIVQQDSGFSAWPDIDPVILADVARHGALVTIDATRIAQEAVTGARPEFPPPPPTPYTVSPKVLQVGLTAAMITAQRDIQRDILLVPDALASDDSTDPTLPMRIKLAKTFADFSLSSTSGNADWKGNFVTTLAGSANSGIRVSL